jgi:hypothetical protein
MQGGEWYPATPHEADAWLADVGTVWWVAGGWAIDLYLGRVTRGHVDVDVGIPRRDAPSVLGALAAWEFFEAKDGALTRLPSGTPPRSDVHSLWGRRIGSSAWELELMLDCADGEHWFYRRAPRIRRPFAEILCRAEGGLRYLAPEIQLLYKSKRVRPRDDEDFRSAVPKLAAPAREWLRAALAIAQPGHRWIAELGA